MRPRGFSLIEVMVVVAIVGILAMIAYPSYQNHVLKTRRRAAEACLVELAQWMERYYTTQMSYAGATLPSTQCQSDLGEFYDFGFPTAAPPTATTFTLEARPQGAQLDDPCGTLSYDNAGQKSASGGAGDCW